MCPSTEPSRVRAPVPPPLLPPHPHSRHKPCAMGLWGCSEQTPAPAQAPVHRPGIAPHLRSWPPSRGGSSRCHHPGWKPRCPCPCSPAPRPDAHSGPAGWCCTAKRSPDVVSYVQLLELQAGCADPSRPICRGSLCPALCCAHGSFAQSMGLRRALRNGAESQRVPTSHSHSSLCQHPGSVQGQAAHAQTQLETGKGQLPRLPAPQQGTCIPFPSDTT